LTDPRKIASFHGADDKKKKTLEGKKMTRKILFTAVVLMLAGIAVAARDSKSVKLKGYIIDNACAAGRATGDNAAEKVKSHTVKCALMPKCAESGYALYADGKLYKLDAEGNKKAAELLKNTKVEKGMQVAVEGTLDGETLTVTSISEVTS
jgi:hypothetical protein